MSDQDKLSARDVGVLNMMARAGGRIQDLEARIAELESENDALRKELAVGAQEPPLEDVLAGWEEEFVPFTSSFCRIFRPEEAEDRPWQWRVTLLGHSELRGTCEFEGEGTTLDAALRAAVMNAKDDER